MDLQTRVKNILTDPAREWPVIAAETTDVPSLIRDYAAPVSAIAAVSQVIGSTVVGVSMGFLGRYRVGLVRGVANGIVTWVFGLVGVWLAAVIIEKLAPSFQSRGTTTDALKLVVYASTPVWIAGVLNIVPPLAVLILIAGLYAIYVFYLGVPVVMHTPPDKVVAYMIVSALVVIAVSIVLGLITTALVGVGAVGGGL